MAKGNKQRKRASYYYTRAYGESKKAMRIARDAKIKQYHKDMKEIRECDICKRKWKCRKTSENKICYKCRNGDRKNERGKKNGINDRPFYN